jgi:lipid II:glycine glycyltransferase (peptidoglycan interpeptide bridge formation enzyme)
MVVYKEHNFDGSEKINGEANSGFVQKLQSLGYIHMGYNNGMEASKPRWNAITTLDNNIIALYNSISKEARDKIMEASRMGNKIYKGSMNDISLLYNVINKSTPPLDYYLDYYQFYGQNSFEIYFTKLEPIAYVNSSKSIYEKEEQRNNELNMQMQDFNNPYKDSIINEKLKSDELLAKYKKNMLEASNLFQRYPSGLITAGVAVVKYGSTVTFFASGINETFKDQNPEYLLKWQLIQQYAMQGYKIANLGGMTSELKKDYDSTLKSEMSNKIVEYVGEFDLVINKKAYYTGSRLNPILNWLNTPI